MMVKVVLIPVLSSCNRKNRYYIRRQTFILIIQRSHVYYLLNTDGKLFFMDSKYKISE